MKTNLFTLLISFALIINVTAQVNEKKRANFWHFGNQAALDFTCLPTSFTGSQMNAFEGSASISDTNGILQFYTQGTTVWDRNNAVMPNGTGLLGNASSAQSAIITPHPGNPDHYFIFTTDAIWENNGLFGLQWHEVDMTLNGSSGDVISKNNQLIDRVQEKLVAVRNATSTGYWVVIQKSDPSATSGANVGSNEYHAYEVTAAGVNPVPVISTTGPLVTWQSYGMYMSPQGDVMVNIHPDLNVYDFDNSTGALVHRWAAALSPFLGNFEFSPDGNLLYGCRNSEIFQMDLNAANVAAFQASQIQVSTTGIDMKAVQLGPDCKLYGLSAAGNAVHTINNPNIMGVGCGFTQNAITLVSGSGGFALTNFCSSFFEFPCGNRLGYDVSGTNASCSNDGTATVINLTGTAPFVFSWSTGATTQSVSNLAGGTYFVTVSDASGCMITDSILISQPQTINIDNAIVTNLSSCSSNDGSVDLTTSVGGSGALDTIFAEGFETDGQGSRYTANPYPGNTSTSFFFMRGDDASLNFSNDPTGEEGSFYFGARRTGFSTIPTICDVTFNTANVTGYTNLEMCAYLALGRNNMSVDANTRITLEYNIDGTGWNTLMDFRQGLANPFPANNLYEDTDGDGVGDGAALSTTFQDFCYSIPATGNNVELRVTTNASGSSLRQTAFDYVRLKGTPPYSYTYLWSTGDTTQDVSNLSDGTYTVQITGTNGCVVTDTFTVTDPCVIPILNASFILSNTTICEGDSITFTDNSTGSVTGWTWTFNGGIPASATTQGTHTIGFNTSGNYNINLQVSDGTNTDDTTIAIIVLPHANGTNSTAICQGDSILLGGSFQTTAGTYNDTLFNSAANGCDSIVATTLSITPKDNAAFTYPAANYCLTDPNPIATIAGTTGGTFTIDNSGTINPTTGELNVTTSGSGNFIITYTTNGTCPESSTFNISISNGFDATITLAGTFCSGDTAINFIAVDPNGIWSGNGITNTTFGTFDPSVSGAGSHEIIYTISGSCGDADTIDVIVNPITSSTATASICQGDSILLGGAFQTLAGTYNDTILNGSVNGCDSILATTLSITPKDNASFSYPAASYCLTDPNPIATIAGTTGGNFTINNGGTINPTTGEIDVVTSGSGNFIITYTTNGICPDDSTFSVSISSGFDATITLIGPFCAGDAATNLVAVDPNGTWSGNGITNTAIGTFDPSISGAGTHEIIYTISGSCGDADTIDVIVNPITSSTSIASICQGDSILLGGAFQTLAGTYNDTILNGSANGCDSIVATTLSITPKDNAAFTYPATSYCLTDPNPTATITGTTGGTFSINNGGAINPTTGELDVTTSGAGNYIITYTTNGTCPDINIFNISITNQQSATITLAGPFCAGDAAINLIAVDPNGIWNGNGITNTTSGTFNPSVAGAGIHEIIYTISGSCGDADTINIKVSASPTLTLQITDDNCFSEEGSIISLVNGGISPYSYSWDNGEITPSIANLSAGIYTLTVNDSIGCSSSVSGTVNDLSVDCDYHIFLPNIFSPNGDGQNDVFMIRGQGVETVNLIVYSRWGEKVFETNSIENGWDGTFKGKKMNSAVFVYYLTAKMLNDKTVEKQGNVTLVR